MADVLDLSSKGRNDIGVSRVPDGVVTDVLDFGTNGFVSGFSAAENDWLVAGVSVVLSYTPDSTFLAVLEGESSCCVVLSLRRCFSSALPLGDMPNLVVQSSKKESEPTRAVQRTKQ